MSAINQLNQIDTLSGSDLIPVWSQANGDARKSSLTTLLTWINSQSVVSQDNKVTQYAAPLAASTTLLTDTQNSVWLILTPAGTIATATLKLPLVSNCVAKQELLINTTQTITTLTLDANGGSIIGGPSTLASNGFFCLRFDAVLKTWYRVG